MKRNQLRDWDDLRYFLAVARTGSLTKAGTLVQANQSTVGRRLRAMDAFLGVKLFDRHTNGMRLTPAGLELLDEAVRMESIAQTIERRISGLDREMVGVVRITGTTGLLAHWLSPRLVTFQREHAGIVIEVVASNEVLDLGKREADIALRLARPADPRLVGKRVGLMRFGLFGVQSYLNIYGTPRCLDDLTRHRIVDHAAHHASRALASWAAFVRDRAVVGYRTNSSTAFFEAVRHGFGIGAFPLYTPKVIPELQLLPIDIDCSAEIWLISHEETNRRARTRAVIDHISALFDQDRADWFS